MHVSGLSRLIGEALEDHPNGRRLALVDDQLAVLEVVAERNEAVARKVLNNSIRVRLINPLKRCERPI